MKRLSFIRPWQVVTILCIVYVMVVLAANDNNPMALVTIGPEPTEGGSMEGYDGQFVYHISRDPSNAAKYMDVPAYRMQRILLPALGWVFSFGQEALVPWVLLVINLIALAGGTAALEHLLHEKGYSRWYALGYGLTLGIFGSVRFSLTEPLAYGLAIIGIAFFHHKRLYWSAAIFALAMLSKETVVFFPMGLTLYLFYQKRWKEGFVFGAISIIPFAIWQLILFQHLGAFGLRSGGGNFTSFEIIPFAGFWKTFDYYEEEVRGQYHISYLLLYIPMIFLPTFYGLIRPLIDARHKIVSIFSIMLFLNALIILVVPTSTFGSFFAIMRFLVGLQISIILYAAHHKQTRALRYSTLWSLTIAFAFSYLTPFPI